MYDKVEAAFLAFKDNLIDNFPSLLFGAVILFIFIFIGLAAQGFTKRRLITRMDDPLLVNFIGRTILLIFITIGSLIFLNQVGLGKAASGLVAGAGVSALILGFAFKDIGENFLAGFFLAFSRPFHIGNVIEIEGLKGTVQALSFRTTHIRTFDGKDIFLPNAMLIKSPLINYTRDGLLRHDFIIGLDYGDDVPKAIQTIISSLNDEERIEHDGDLMPFIQLEEFGTSTLNLRMYYWINSFDFTGSVATLKTEIMYNVFKALSDANFNMPADIIELKIYQEGQPIPLKMISDAKK